MHLLGTGRHFSALCGKPSAEHGQEKILTAQDGEDEPKEGHGATPVCQEPLGVADLRQSGVAPGSPRRPNRQPTQVEGSEQRVGQVVAGSGVGVV